MLIKSMGPVSETGEEYVMDCYFRQTWQDDRLMFEFPGMEEFSLPWLFLDRVWKPDTFFMNGKKSHLHHITVPNKFLRLRFDGALTYSMRLTVKASCPMHLRKFPLDTQKCPLLIGSYGYLSSDVLYRWKDGTAVLEEGVELAQYDLINISTEAAQNLMRGRDEYSMIKVSFTMKRHTGYFMLQVFAPCCLIVCCSWVSFWIDPDAVPARVTLGVSSVLSMTTMGFGGRAQMPRVSYATALDWFVILCFSNVFAVMVEYAFINFIDTITSDLKRLLEQKGIKKPAKPPADPASPPADGSALPPAPSPDALPALTTPAAPAVPVLVVDLAPGADLLDPVYAEVADASPASAAATPSPYGYACVGGRTPVLSNQRGECGGEEVLLASMVLSPTGDALAQPANDSEDAPGAANAPPPAPRRGRRPLVRRKSLADLPSDVERGGGGAAGVGTGASGAGRRRASAGVGVRRDSTLLCVPGLADHSEEDEDEDLEEDFEDEQPLDTLEALEVSIRGSVMELRAALGTAAAGTRRSLRHYLRKPLEGLRTLHLFPTQQSVTSLILSDDPPPKFSRIDIASRRYFPLIFSLLLSLYWILYIYYITDDFPAKVFRNLNTRQQRAPALAG